VLQQVQHRHRATQVTKKSLLKTHLPKMAASFYQMKDPVYKVFTEPEWKVFQEKGRFKGSQVDLNDGFIHMSTKEQVEGVIERFFKGVRPLYIATFSSPDLAQHLMWESSDSKELYPHLYHAELLVSDVANYRAIT